MLLTRYTPTRAGVPQIGAGCVTADEYQGGAMMKRSTAGLVAVTWLFCTLACAGGSANADDTAAAPQQDPAQATEPPPVFRGMAQATTGAEHQPTPVGKFLDEQGTGVPTETAGYGGLERQDTSAAEVGDTSGMTGADTASTSGWSDTTSTTGTDTSGTSGYSDTTGTSSMDTTGQQ